MQQFIANLSAWNPSLRSGMFELCIFMMEFLTNVNSFELAEIIEKYYSSRFTRKCRCDCWNYELQHFFPSHQVIGEKITIWTRKVHLQEIKI